jgi:phage-related protein
MTMPHFKPLKFRGSALHDLRKFSVDARREAGFALERLQLGREPHDWKPMSAIGTGVREIRVQDYSGAYRVIYIAKLADAIYVLHCFQKKSPKTSKPDIAIARQRLVELLKELQQ